MLSNSRLPLQVVFVLGVVVVTCALGLASYALVGKLSGEMSSGVPSILIAIAFFSGLNIASIGVVALYISRIYDQVKGRPRYIISEVIE
jgi:dolichol-phosphate mannosyltransferase